MKTGTAKRRSAPVVVPSGVFLIRISTNPFQIRRKSRRETKIQRRLVESSSTKIIWSFNILKILSNFILTNCYQIFFQKMAFFLEMSIFVKSISLSFSFFTLRKTFTTPSGRTRGRPTSAFLFATLFRNFGSKTQKSKEMEPPSFSSAARTYTPSDISFSPRPV